MAVTPSSKVRVTVSAKDLKPESSSLVSFMRAFLSWTVNSKPWRRRALLGGGILRRDDE